VPASNNAASLLFCFMPFSSATSVERVSSRRAQGRNDA
jgi:hypothetical protein